MEIVTVVGARPQFIKAAALSRVLRRTHREYLVHTGQHYDANMSEVFFRELSIPEPDANLGVQSSRHGEMTGLMLDGLELVLLERRPDAVLVYGDTNSTLAGALAAAKLHIPVLHVEAGLRSFDRAMPEELNRVLTDHLSARLFCPTRTAVANLAAEGIVEGVVETGDVMLDATLFYADLAARDYPDLAAAIGPENAKGLAPGGYYVATVHRAENTDDPDRLRAILAGFARLDAPVVWPIHPRTRAVLRDRDLGTPNVVAVEPLGYLAMLRAVRDARKVLTDSGGLQKEAYFLSVPCVTLRDTTEWVETLDGGWNVLAPLDAERIAALAASPFDRASAPRAAAFGDGHAAERIVEAIDGMA